MIKTFIKAGLKLSLILVLTIGCLFVTSTILRPNKIVKPEDTTVRVDGFYALEKNSLDVLFLGTSHSYFGFNPSLLWKETGLGSYVFAGECQPIEITYRYLEEALKTQNPSLIVLDIFGVSETTEACKTEGIYRVNIEDMRLSGTKIKAYKELENQSLLENIIDVSIYHTRLKDLEKQDLQKAFTKQFNDNFGFTLGYTYERIIRDRELLEVSQSVKPSDDKWDSFIKIIELCKEEEIPILLVKTPYYIEESDAKIYNYVWEYADANDIDYIDFNKLTKEIGYVFDVDGDLWHANARGSKKITDYISTYINHNYQITPNISIYDDAYRNLYAKTEYALLSLEYNIEMLMDNIDDLDVTLAISYNDNGEIPLSVEKLEILSQLGYNFDGNSGMNQLRIINNKNIEQEKYAYDDDQIEFEINEFNIVMDTDGNIFVDGQLVNNPYSNICIGVFDNATGYPVDIFYIDASTNDLTILRK